MLSRRMFMAASTVALTGRGADAKAETLSLSRLWSGLEFVDATGRAFRLSDMQQPLKLVNLWASWCSACLVEMQSFETLARVLGEQNLKVLLVSNPEDWRRDQLCAQRLRLPFQIVTLPPTNPTEIIRSALLDRNGAVVVPRTILFSGKENRVALQQMGTLDWSTQVGRVRGLLS